MKKIALYGGNFDPPHLGHVLVITNVLNAGIIDRLILVPTGDDRLQKPLVASGESRLAMLQALLTECFPDAPIEIDTIQIDGKLPGSFAVDLVESYATKYPEDKLYYIVGSDHVPSLDRWVNFEKLVTLINFISVPRSGYEITEFPEFVTQLPGEIVPINNFSSSEIRQMLKSGKYLSGILPISVINFIKSHSLYS